MYTCEHGRDKEDCLTILEDRKETKHARIISLKKEEERLQEKNCESKVYSRCYSKGIRPRFRFISFSCINTEEENQSFRAKRKRKFA